MPTVQPAVPGTSREQQITYYAGLLDQFAAEHGVPSYTGNDAKFQGQTWGAIYQDIMAAHPKLSPLTTADQVLGVIATASLTHSMSQADAFLGKFLTTAEKSVAQTNFAGPAGGLLTGINAIGDFFSRLTEASTWLRLAEGVLGVILIAVGVARLTHAVPIATKIAGAVA